MPYFYIPVPRGFDIADLDAFIDALNVSWQMFRSNTPRDLTWYAQLEERRRRLRPRY